MTRKPREFESRTVDEKANNEKRFDEHTDLSYAQLGTLHIDTSLMPDGMQYGWIVETIRGTPQKEAMRSALKKGWRPVPASRHKEFTFHDMGLFADEKDDLIRRGGQILMEIPIDKYEAINRQYDYRQRQVEESVKNLTSGMSDDPSMPFYGQTNISRSHKF